MNLLRVLTTSIMALSIVGCSTGRNCVVDPCGPCSNGPVIGGGILRFFALPSANSSCYQSGGCGGAYYDNYDYGNPAVGCGQCGCAGKPFRPFGSLFGRPRCGGNCASQACDCSGGMTGCGCGGSMGSTYGAPSGCGCGQNYGSPMSPNMGSSVPPIMGSPAPKTLPDAPTIAPAPPASSPQPNLEIDPSAMNRGAAGQTSRMVSYEEFQRLPGTIISGPGATTTTMTAAAPAPTNNVNPPMRTAATTVSAPRQSINMPQPTPPAQSQQAVWVPSKTY